MRTGRPSTTSTWVATLRGLGGTLLPGVADDDFARALVPTPYRELSALVARFPVLSRALYRSVAALTRGGAAHMTMRTRAIDDAIARAVLVGDTRQLIILGAGLDARAHRLACLRDVDVFEVDHPSTQIFKRERARALPSLARSLRYVATNFEGDDLSRALDDAGHDATKPSVIVWEGVVMYLSGDAIRATLDVLKARAASRSTLAVTYFQASARTGSLDGRALSRLLGAVGEPVRTRWSPTRARAMLAQVGFEVESDEADPEWGPRYLDRNMTWTLERLAVATRV